ncbi:HAD-like domain-containing protein [Melampsora americana]|nr:HAD-like domain-containing protein [Melampsora americana]
MTEFNDIKVIIFDIGGVVAKSPLIGIARFEKQNGLPHDYLNVAMTARGPEGAFQLIETGRIQFPEFYYQFGQEMSDTKFNNSAYEQHCLRTSKPVPPLPVHVSVDGQELWKMMMSEASSFNDPIIQVIKRLKGSGRYKVAALTNNFNLAPGVKEGDTEALGVAPTEVKRLFDDFIESSQVGMRKPDPKFFQYALNRLGAQPNKTVFLDDLGMNLKSAQALGIKTIRVGIYDVNPAIRALQKYVPDVDLLSCCTDPANVSKL